MEQYLKPYNRPATLSDHEVGNDCKLQEFITRTVNPDNGFRRGHAYYEFTNKVENILEGKEVLLQDKKKKNKWFRLDQAKVLAGRLKFYGEEIALEWFGGQYRVFIQSFGSGGRHLPGNSSILYNHIDDQVVFNILPI